MELHVECRPGPSGDLEPTAFSLGGQTISVVEIIDRWAGSDHGYFKIRGNDSCIYILRFASVEQYWELTLFQAKESLEVAATSKGNPVQ